MGFLVAQTVKDPSALQETQVWSLGQEDPLEEGMAIHSSILALRILWTEVSGRLQFTGLQRMRQDWATNTFNKVCMLFNNCNPNFSLIKYVWVYQFYKGHFVSKGTNSQTFTQKYRTQNSEVRPQSFVL